MKGLLRRRRGNRSAILRVGLAVFILAGSPCAWAQDEQVAQSQDPTETTDPDAPEDSVERAKEAQDAAAAMETIANFPDREVTYAEVLADPDNLALSFAFAKTQVKDGNLRGAAATLERILILEPDLAEVRLFYALVLIRLDSIDAAKRELDRLQTYDMPPKLRRQLERYRARIERRRQKTRFDLLVGLGGSYDWNTNSVPSDRVLKFLGVDSTLQDSSARKSDYAYVGFTRIGLEYDLGHQAPDKLVGALTHYRSDQVDVNSQDIASFSANYGLRLAYPDFEITPRLTVDHMELSDQPYYRAYGVRVDLDVPLPPDYGVAGRLSYKRETFNPIQESASADDDSGYRWDMKVTGRWNLSPLERLTFGTTLAYKRGVNLQDSYREIGFESGWRRLFEAGDYVTASVRAYRRTYRRPDRTIEPGNTRKDKVLRLRVGYGTPLGRWVDFDWAGKAVDTQLSDTVFSISAQATERLSHVKNYEYDNRSAEALFTRRWKF